VRVWAIWKWCC